MQSLTKADLDYLEELKRKINPICESINNCGKCPFEHELSAYLCVIDAINALQWTLKPHIK